MFRDFRVPFHLCVLFIVCNQSDVPDPGKHLQSVYKAGSKAHKADIDLAWTMVNGDKMEITWKQGVPRYKSGWCGIYEKERNGDYHLLMASTLHDQEGNFISCPLFGNFGENNSDTYVVIFQPAKYVNGEYVPNGPLVRTKEMNPLQFGLIKRKHMYLFTIIGTAVVFFCIFLCCLCCLCNKSNSKQQKAPNQEQPVTI